MWTSNLPVNPAEVPHLRNIFQLPTSREEEGPSDPPIPETFDDLPDFTAPTPTIAIPRRKHNKYIEQCASRHLNDVVRWNIPHEHIEMVPSRENTRLAIEEYFLRAWRRKSNPSRFLERYYRYETAPRIGKRMTRRRYILYKARIACNKDGVRIPLMDAVCQKNMYDTLLAELNDCLRSYRGEPVEPRPPAIFEPVYNPATMRYEGI